jgi:hypothetical protein
MLTAVVGEGRLGVCAVNRTNGVGSGNTGGRGARCVDVAVSGSDSEVKTARDGSRNSTIDGSRSATTEGHGSDWKQHVRR